MQDPAIIRSDNASICTPIISVPNEAVNNHSDENFVML